MRVHTQAKLLAGILALTLGTLAGCGAPPPPASQAAKRRGVVATLPPLADWCRVLLGDGIAVRTLLPAGRSPHAYEPGPGDARAVSNAALIIGWGGHVDDWLSPLSLAAGRAGDVRLLFQDHAAHAGENPHQWLNPEVTRACVVTLAHELSIAFPDAAHDITARHMAYDAELAALERRMQAATMTWQGEGVVIIHDAWPPFMAASGVSILAALYTESGAPPSAKDMHAAVQALRNARTPAVITERQLSGVVARTLVAETGAALIPLDPLGAERSGETGGYLDMMRGNLAAMEAVFGPIGTP